MNLNLKWRATNASSIVAAFKKSNPVYEGNYVRGGYCCAFIKLTKFSAVKFYYRKSDRDNCYVNQKFAEKHGMAPKTGSIFHVDFRDPKARKTYRLYGYVTEIADTKGFREMHWKDFQSIHRELYIAYKNMGFHYPGDIDRLNIGRLKDKIVVIDYSNFELFDLLKKPKTKKKSEIGNRLSFNV